MTLLLVDDDVEMLETLRSLVDWNSLGFAGILTASSGVDALRQSEGTVIDLMITDIGMPVMDGYALVEHMRGRQSELPCIFLTCHEDFHHARRAIAAGLDDYLVKYSLTAAALQSAVERVLQSRREKQRKVRETQGSVATLQEVRISYKEKLVYTLASGGTIDSVQCDRQMRAMHIRRPLGSFRIIGFYVDYDEARLHVQDAEINRTWRFDAVRTVEDYLREHHCTEEAFPYEGFILLMHEGSSATLSQHYQELLYTICSMMNETMRIHVSLCQSQICNDFFRLGQAINELRSHRDDAFYKPVPLGAKPQPFQEMSYPRFNDACAQLRTALGNEASFWSNLDDYSKRIEEHRYAPHMVRKLFQAILSAITRLNQQNGIFTEEIELSGMSMNFCRDAVTTYYQDYLDRRGMNHRAGISEDVKKILAYVDDHLQEKITLQTAADFVYKNSSYLSRLFKQSMGVSFSDYLISARIRKATELLEHSSLPVEEIAARVGIDNISYFYKFYKRETGRTPRKSR